ncbi:MAG: D-alanyl-D-alanine carboxypeptidase family protein [Bilophila wadsworthia]
MPPSKNPPHGRIPSYSRLTRPRPGRRSPERPKSPRRPKHRVQTDPQCPLRRAHGCPHSKILYSQNPDVRIPPASLTKIMSMMVTFDAIRSGKVKLSDQIRVSRHAARQGGSRMGLRAGERVSLNRLLMGMAVSSGNDASMAVAERVGGSGRAFVKMMNNKARQIGMSSSTFKRPTACPPPVSTPQPEIRRGLDTCLRTIPPRSNTTASACSSTGAVITNKNPPAPGLPRCRRPENRLGHGFRLQYHFHRAARQYAPHRGHPRSGLRRAPQP